MKYYTKVLVDVPCKECGRMDVTHKCKGICTLCYRKHYYPQKPQQTPHLTNVNKNGTL